MLGLPPEVVDDPAVALAVAQVGMREDLFELHEQRQALEVEWARLILEAREVGFSWQEIGHLAGGISRQAARERWHRHEVAADHPPRTLRGG